MYFQTELTGFSKNEYFMQNKGFTGNTWYWKQGNNQEQQNNKLGLQKKQKDLTMITNTIGNATSIESTTVGQGANEDKIWFSVTNCYIKLLK